jgi:hypothetical protein
MKKLIYERNYLFTMAEIENAVMPVSTVAVALILLCNVSAGCVASKKCPEERSLPVG